MSKKKHDCPQCGQDLRVPVDAFAQLDSRNRLEGRVDRELAAIESIAEGLIRRCRKLSQFMMDMKP